MSSVKMIPLGNLLKSSTSGISAKLLPSLLPTISRSSSTSAIQKVGVIGSGQMGLGIAYVALKNAKVQVSLYDNSSKNLEKGVTFLGNFSPLSLS